ncbi:MAG: formate dehydrogenase subunit gamma [Burkholderiaceae bacterium]|jgi:formate dehydrogenase subunit gamma|nr:formate dehydrogenase subunit gamma [Burkholderiaceae bacterium]MDH5208741.1 formate dehydrogenase subunit gamma [Burkholderiaceae bacterium]
MTILSWRVGLAAAVLAFAGHAAAQPATPRQQDSARQQVQQELVQPFNNAPVWRDVRSGPPGFTQVGAPSEQGVLIQSRGETWRQVRVPVSLIGGLLIALAMVSLGGFYAIRGPIPGGESGSKMMIQRFRAADRYAHWTMAIVWVTLAVTGLILTFGKTLLIPVLGHDLYSWLAVAVKNIHNFIGPILIVGVLWMIIRYLPYNWFNKEDFVWLTKIVGNLTGHEYPSGKFNGGEKLVFWFVVVLFTPVLIASGLILNFPNFGQTRATMQTFSIIHMALAYVAIAMACVHIYLGTIGQKGAYRAMRDGYVTAEWAKHHHELWYNDVKAGKVPESPMVSEAAVPEPVRRAVQLAVK